MNTTKLNINNNKVSVDRLNTQMSTQKKITKPSDNPLIAIKSLRLSTTLSQINQYCNNTIRDAQAWICTKTRCSHFLWQTVYRAQSSDLRMQTAMWSVPTVTVTIV